MNNTCPEGDYGFFSVYIEGEVLNIHFRNNLLENLANLSKWDMLSVFVSRVLKSKDIKVILINSDFRDSGCEAYNRFFLEKSQSFDKLDVHRLCNITNQLVQCIIGIDRIVIHACKGNVISLFLNISLACDYRIASKDTMFCNPYLDLGLVPLGGGPYFFSKMMGTGKALEILLLNKDIDSSRALELGLVDRVVSSSDLDKTALNIANKFADNYSGTISGMKKLINYTKKDLKTYFKIEKQEIFKAIHSSDFQKK